MSPDELKDLDLKNRLFRALVAANRLGREENENAEANMWAALSHFFTNEVTPVAEWLVKQSCAQTYYRRLWVAHRNGWPEAMGFLRTIFGAHGYAYPLDDRIPKKVPAKESD